MNRIKRITDQQDVNRVAYIMINTFRINQNHGLYYALELANTHNVELDIYGYHIEEENPRQNYYFSEGISNFDTLKEIGVKGVYLVKSIKNIQSCINDYTHVICDKCYQKDEILAFDTLKHHFLGTLYTSESNLLVPVEVTSNKEEYSARTIRSKIWNKCDNFSEMLPEYNVFFIKELEANNKFIQFMLTQLDNYHHKNDPGLDYTSKMSVYLKYGFISPVTIYNLLESSISKNKDLYLEEVIIRRELAYNFVYYNKSYDKFDSITYEWSYKSMNVHLVDEREYLYDIVDYLNYRTHDKYFNTAMKQMVETGYMHGYMRMYWCKKIIEWSKTYEEAYAIAIKLNNYYFLDGNTPNGYTGVAWCFGKHDRAFKERSIFGKLRYMSQDGLKRKFHMESYYKE